MSKKIEKYLYLKDGKPYTIRTAVPGDAPRLISYTKSVFKESRYLLTTADEFNVPLEKEEEFLRKTDESEGKLALIAEYDGEIIGFLDFHNGHKKRIMHQGSFGISVRSDFQHQGVGKALLQTLLEWAKDHPLIEKINLEVFAANTNAIRLYEKFGFYIEGVKKKEIKMEDGTYHDVLLMALFLQ